MPPLERLEITVGDRLHDPADLERALPVWVGFVREDLADRVEVAVLGQIDAEPLVDLVLLGLRIGHRARIRQEPPPIGILLDFPRVGQRLGGDLAVGIKCARVCSARGTSNSGRNECSTNRRLKNFDARVI